MSLKYNADQTAAIFELRRQLERIGVDKDYYEITAYIISSFLQLTGESFEDQSSMELFHDFLPIVEAEDKEAVKTRINAVLASMGAYEVMNGLILKID